MKQLKARARAEEAVYVNRETQEFMVQASGMRRLGEWAAEMMMGENAPAVATYADALVRSGVAGSNSFQCVFDDLHLAGREVSENELSSRFEQYLEEARNAL